MSHFTVHSFIKMYKYYITSRWAQTLEQVRTGN